MILGISFIFSKLPKLPNYPKASITQLSYDLYTLVTLDFHPSDLNGHLFFAIDLL